MSLWETIAELSSNVRIMRIVRAYESGTRFRFGRVHSTVGPGLHWLWPVVDDIMVKTVVPRLVDLVDQSITMECGKVVGFSGALEYSIFDVTLALTAVDDLADSIQTKAMGYLARYIRSHTYSEYVNIENHEDAIVDELNGVVCDWGVMVHAVWLTDFAPQRVIRLVGQSGYSTVGAEE